MLRRAAEVTGPTAPMAILFCNAASDCLSDQVDEIVDGAGAEEEQRRRNCVEDFATRAGSTLLAASRAVGDDFGDVGAESFEGADEIGVARSLRGRKTVLLRSWRASSSARARPQLCFVRRG